MARRVPLVSLLLFLWVLVASISAAPVDEYRTHSPALRHPVESQVSESSQSIQAPLSIRASRRVLADPLTQPQTVVSDSPVSQYSIHAGFVSSVQYEKHIPFDEEVVLVPRGIDIFKKIKEGFQHFGEAVKKKFTDFGHNVKKKFEDFGHKAKAAFQDFGHKAKNAFVAAGKAIKDVGAKIGKVATRVISGVTGAIATVAQATGIGAAIAAPLRAVSAATGAASDAIKTHISNAWDKADKVFKVVADPIKAAVGAVAGAIKNKVKKH